MRTLQQAIRWGMSLSKFNSKIDYYTVLNLSAAASPIQIKKAFKELAKKYHPDVAKGNQDKFKEINEAYQVLSSADTKREYDQSRSQPVGKSSSGAQPSSSGSRPHQQNQHYPPEEEEEEPEPRQRRQFTQEEIREQYRKQHEEQMNRYSQQRKAYDDLGKTYDNYDRFSEDLMRKKASHFQTDKVTMDSVKHQEELRKRAYDARRHEDTLRRQRELKKEVQKRYNKAKENSQQMVDGFRKMGDFFKDMFGKK